MGYNKIVVSGDVLELYEYEREISLFSTKRFRKSGASRIDNQVLSFGRDDSLGAWQGRRKDNAGRARVAFSRLVRANLGRVDFPVLFTLTYEENQVDLSRGYRDFTSFVQSLRYSCGHDFRYVAVPEFQKRGAVHFHALVWGISEELVLQERQTRFFARSWGKGFVYLKFTDGDRRLATYLAKYMTKAYSDVRLKGKKAYVGSRNLLRPKQFLGVSPVWPILDQYHLSTVAPLQVKEYTTLWLGKGRYSRFIIDSK